MAARKSRKRKPQPKPPRPPVPFGPGPRPVGHPVFAQPQPTADPTTFRVTNPSDGPAYTTIDQLYWRRVRVPKVCPTRADLGASWITRGYNDRMRLVFGGKTLRVVPRVMF